MSSSGSSTFLGAGGSNGFVRLRPRLRGSGVSDVVVVVVVDVVVVEASEDSAPSGLLWDSDLLRFREVGVFVCE